MWWFLGCAASEVCGNGVDDDGDRWADCADPACDRFCDSDADGARDAAYGGPDCDDGDASVRPGAREVCDGIDDDCDGAIDDADPDVDRAGSPPAFVDTDGDGFGTAPTPACPGPGVALASGDCDDLDAARFPGAPEACGGVDRDCDGAVDLDDPDATPVALFVDADGDGFGDPRSAVLGCPGPGWVEAAGDCDDLAPAVFAGAPEVCDGLDDDCDGALPADELDGDADGDPACADCDDADPARGWGHEERCGDAAVDEDCDGLVDFADPTLNVYSCGICPSPDVYDPALVHAETWNPCVLDPDAAALCDPDTDTHAHGERLHRVSWRTDQGFWRDPLLVYLPPGFGGHNDTLRTWAAWAGYRVVALGYPNEDGLQHKCDDAPDTCFQDAMHEIAFGGELSSWVDVGWPDSIERRLEVLLATLAVEHPDVGFDRYLRADGGVDWSRVVVAGWSGGGAEAAYLAKVERVSGGLLLSAPKDHHEEPLVPADWVAAPGSTPGCGLLATWHVDEPFAAPPESILDRAYDLLGLPAGSWDVDTDAWPIPAGTARITQSLGAESLPEGCSPHGAVGDDDCLRDELLPAYLWMLCAADDLAATCAP